MQLFVDYLKCVHIDNFFDCWCWGKRQQSQLFQQNDVERCASNYDGVNVDHLVMKVIYVYAYHSPNNKDDIALIINNDGVEQTRGNQPHKTEQRWICHAWKYCTWNENENNAETSANPSQYPNDDSELDDVVWVNQYMTSTTTLANQNIALLQVLRTATANSDAKFTHADLQMLLEMQRKLPNDPLAQWQTKQPQITEPNDGHEKDCLRKLPSNSLRKNVQANERNIIIISHLLQCLGANIIIFRSLNY